MALFNNCSLNLAVMLDSGSGLALMDDFTVGGVDEHLALYQLALWYFQQEPTIQFLGPTWGSIHD